MASRENRPQGAKSQGSRSVQGRAPSVGAHARAGGESGGRPPAGQVWIYGVHATLAALGNPGRRIRRLLLTPEAQRSHGAAIAQIRAARPLPGDESADKAALDHLLPPGAVHQGIATLADALPAQGIEDVIDAAAGRQNAVVLVLDQVTDPHNVGAILRSAAAFGAVAVVVPDRHSPEETGTLAKSASGALERMALVRVVNIARTLDSLKQAGFWVAGLAGEATTTLAQANLSGRVVLVLGAEGDGLRRLTRDHCDLLAKLPMTGAVESLNVSNAAAISLYELARSLPPATGDGDQPA